MKDEQLRDLLFGKKAKDVPLKTISTYRERRLLPSSYTYAGIERWKNTFVGNLLYHYPMRSGIIMTIAQAIGKTPTMSDFTESNLRKIVEVLQTKAPNSAKQMASQIKSTLTRLMESDDCTQSVPCKRFNHILSLDGCPTTKAYLGVEDLKKFLNYTPQTECERVCHARYSIMLMTGARYSDAEKLKRANIQDGILTYVPQKTKSHGTVVSIPVSERIAECIDILSNAKRKYSLPKFNETIRSICKNCGLDEEVTYFWGGKYVTKPKWEAMRSHLGRASFVTNMLKMGLQIHEVSKMAGHTDIAMTSRYNASTDVNLNEKAKAFINMDF